MKFSFEDFKGISNPYPSLLLMNQVLSEQGLAVLATEACQGFQRILPGKLPAIRVYGGDPAPSAGLGHLKRNFTDLDAFHSVFFKSFTSGNDKIRAETTHLHRFVKSLVEILQGCDADQQKGESIGKRSPFGILCKIRIDVSPAGIRHEDRSAWSSEKLAEPISRIR